MLLTWANAFFQLLAIFAIKLPDKSGAFRLLYWHFRFICLSRAWFHCHANVIKSFDLCVCYGFIRNIWHIIRCIFIIFIHLYIESFELCAHRTDATSDFRQFHLYISCATAAKDCRFSVLLCVVITFIFYFHSFFFYWYIHSVCFVHNR